MKVYLSKSGVASSDRVEEARLALQKDPEVEIVEYTGATYSNQELLNSDILFLVLREDGLGGELDGEDVDVVWVGKGQYEQVRDAFRAKIPVYVIMTQSGGPDPDACDIYFKEVQAFQEDGGDWKTSYGILHLTGPVYNLDWNSDSLPSAVLTQLKRNTYASSNKRSYRDQGPIPVGAVERGPIPDFDKRPRLLLCSTHIL